MKQTFDRFVISLDFLQDRWWDQFQSIPWPYGIAVYVSSTIQGYDEVGRAMRRTIMRYVCLSLTMVFRVLSLRVKKRFPKMSDLVDAGLLTQSELKIIEQMDQKFPGYSKNWLPIVWAASIVNRARNDGRIRDDFAVKTLIEEFNKFRGACGTLMNYNAICIPLVYVQVVTIAVYTYFLSALLSQQYVMSKSSHAVWNLDYIPILITLKFIFYMGWLKVAETMMNPFGDDDDDFEISYMIDRNIQMSYLIVDEMHNEHPELLKDQYWDEIPKNLPDNMKEEDDEKEKHEKPFEPTDIFDVVQNTSSTQRNVTFNVPNDIEAPVESNETLDVKESLVTVKPDLKPRASVIDATYLNRDTIQKDQSDLEIQMERIRQKTLTSIDSDSSVLVTPSDSPRGSKEAQNPPKDKQV